jgi:hypothetical protein
VQLFPERERRGRRTLALAVALSVLVHLTASTLWPLMARTHARTPPAEDVMARTDRITIETVPSPSPKPTPTPQPVAVQLHTSRALSSASERLMARVLAAPPAPVPTLAPLPPVTVAHTRTVFHQPVEPHARAPAAGSRMPVLAPNDLAAYEGAFRRTIAQTHANGSVAGAGNSRALTRAEEILGGTFGEAVDFGGTCRDYAPQMTRGGFVYHYLTCRVSFSDGFTELASYPWPFRFPVDRDPIGAGVPFAEATPPPGFVLPPDFQPSRRVCTFYHAACADKLSAQRAAQQP